jgi:hypothetical protein
LIKKVSLDENNMVEMVIKLHDNVQQHIRRKNEQYASKANEGCRRVIFESSD